MNDNRSILEASEGYKFTAEKNSYSHLLLCKICSKLMIEPTRLYPCGHTFCKSCILEYNKKVHQLSQCTRQNKCFVTFPQCGKYYITLQPDLLAASLIDDLEIKCLSEGCPWTGPLERFKNNHKYQCKLKEGGLNSWLNDFNEGAKSIKKVREERINSNCIDIDDGQEDKMEDLQDSNHNNTIVTEKYVSKAMSNLIKASNGPSQPNKQDKQTIKQRTPLLGLNKDKVGDHRKRHSKLPNNESNIMEVIDDDQNAQQERQSKLSKNYNNLSKQCPINLVDDQDASQTQTDEKQHLKAQKNKSLNSNTKKIEQNYTGLKMITSYKKKSHKIVQNPHNMSLTRSQPQTLGEDQNINI